MLRVDGAGKTFGGQRVLDDASLALRPGERAALVGRNGSGKSTLLRIVAGLEEPDAGRVVFPPGTRVGYLPQDPFVQAGRSVREEVLSGARDLLGIEAEMRALEKRLASGALSGDEMDEAVQQHAILQETFSHGGGYALEAELGRVLAGLGFQAGDETRLTEEFSGGWQMRISLARALLAQPTLFLLDEPTNHLDLPAIEWLEEYLKGARASVLVVSHDRAFLDSIAQRVFEVRRRKIDAYVGNYSAYRVARAQRDATGAKAAERHAEEKEKLEAYVRRYRAGNRATQAKSRERMLERLEATRPDAPDREKAVHFELPACVQSGQEVVRLDHVRRSYGERLVLDDVSLVVERGERVALIGLNGAGKSTLLRTMSGQERPQHGQVSTGVNVRMGFFAQDQAEHLDPSATVLQEVERAAPATWDVQSTRDLLGQLLFSGDAQMKPVAGLSGGERSRVALAKLIVRSTNLLLLDEPTNHLDLTTRDALEGVLASYPGTIVFATHDRYLVNRLATQVVDVGGVTARVYPGNYAAYQRARAREQEIAASAAAAENRARAEAAPSRDAPAPPRGGREQRRLAADIRDVERQVAEGEEALKRVEEKLSDPAEYGGDVAALAAEHEVLQKRVAELVERWEELALRAEGAA